MSELTRQVEITGLAVNYYNWLIEEVTKYCGSVVFEVGSGTGIVAEGISRSGRRVIVNEVDGTMCRYLRERFSGNENVTVIEGDIIGSPLECSKLKNAGIDTVVMINVLEHFEDDLRALVNVKEVFNGSGRLILYVPAYDFLFGPFDRVLGHYRRYSKRSLVRVIELAGYKVRLVKAMHLTGIPGWFLYKVTGVWSHSPSLLELYDRYVIPLSRLIERLIKSTVGLSYFCVAELLSDSVFKAEAQYSITDTVFLTNPFVTVF